jgi:hypothetical protein
MKIKTGLVLLLLTAAVGMSQVRRTPAEEPLLDWSAWERYRTTVVHPAGTIKPADVERAKENMRRYEWARGYAQELQRGADAWLGKFAPEWLTTMIPLETPGDSLFTPCPACRDLKKPAHPHGQYRWDEAKPNEMTCEVCGTVYPNDKYPEDMVFTTKSGQKLSFYGGPEFVLFGFATRPSFTASIRARKVAQATRACRELAEAYALTGKSEYARGARKLLLRFAEVYPNWLVHVGYGEYADMDPYDAALNIRNLPENEITPAPGGPDKSLHSGYWQGGRATGTGMEAGFVRQMLEAYSFVVMKTGGAPVLSEEERLKIEKDLLLESTVLLAADKAVNNKSVGNATAVALAGMVLGHPEMVRFGLDVFMKTVDGWFLPDGGTSESYSYATMTLHGIEALGQAFRGYGDPPGYKDAKGGRIDKIDLYHDTAYARVWQAMFNGQQGDLRYPPLADGHLTTDLGAHFAELMADNYPENGQYLALLGEFAGMKRAGAEAGANAATRPMAGKGKAAPSPTLIDIVSSGGDVRTAIYTRPPGIEEKAVPPLTLPDIVFPALQFGYLRSGPHGRDSCLVLSASDWGIHHHFDSLGLYFWQNGRELLSDLGYLWDHQMSLMSRRTFAHNTVMIDGAEQVSKERGGKFMMFAPDGPIKVMEAESRAYPQASLYRRTIAQVEFEPGRLYVLDIFRVQGGQKHQYVFHGPGNAYELATPSLETVGKVEGLDLEKIRASSEAGKWLATWKLDTTSFRALWDNEPGERSLVGDGWGQRDFRNSDVGALLPYFVRERVNGAAPSAYVTVFEGAAEGAEVVRGLRRLAVPEALAGDVLAVAVDTAGGTDTFVSCLRPVEVKLETSQGTIVVNGRFGAVSVRGGKVAASTLVEGTVLSLGGRKLRGK